MRTLYEKLVRDLVPEIIEEEGKYPKVRTLDGAEYRKLLLKKLVEEAQEAADAGDDKSALLKELADVKETYLAICGEFGVSDGQVEDARMEKRKARGGFEKKIFLEYVEYGEDDA